MRVIYLFIFQPMSPHLTIWLAEINNEVTTMSLRATHNNSGVLRFEQRGFEVRLIYGNFIFLAQLKFKQTLI